VTFTATCISCMQVVLSEVPHIGEPQWQALRDHVGAEKPSLTDDGIRDRLYDLSDLLRHFNVTTSR
jgi:hypothetical protein